MEDEMTKVLWVVAGALVDKAGRVLLTERPAGKNLAGFWEFPGGKIESGETPREALVRELGEELGIAVNPKTLIPCTFASYDYPEFHLAMPVFVCREWTGDVSGKEGQNFVWTDWRNTPTLAPADTDLAKVLRIFLKNF